MRGAMCTSFCHSRFGVHTLSFLEASSCFGPASFFVPNNLSCCCCALLPPTSREAARNVEQARLHTAYLSKLSFRTPRWSFSLKLSPSFPARSSHSCRQTCSMRQATPANTKQGECNQPRRTEPPGRGSCHRSSRQRPPATKHTREATQMQTRTSEAYFGHHHLVAHSQREADHIDHRRTKGEPIPCDLPCSEVQSEIRILLRRSLGPSKGAKANQGKNGSAANRHATTIEWHLQVLRAAWRQKPAHSARRRGAPKLPKHTPRAHFLRSLNTKALRLCFFEALNLVARSRTAAAGCATDARMPPTGQTPPTSSSPAMPPPERRRRDQPP